MSYEQKKFQMLKPCVVLAGGEGRRIQEITSGRVPKPMLTVAGHPFIYHKLNSLRFLGFSDIFVITGHQASLISSYLTEVHLAGVNVHVLSDGPQLLGTGGGIRRHLSEFPETFWVTYADSITVCDISLASTRLLDSKYGVMTVRDNSFGHELGNVLLSDDRQWVTKYEKLQPSEALQWIDFGLLRLSRAHFSKSPSGNFDLSVVLKSMVKSGELRALITDNNYFDIGTVESYRRTCAIADTSLTSEWWT